MRLIGEERGMSFRDEPCAFNIPFPKFIAQRIPTMNVANRRTVAKAAKTPSVRRVESKYRRVAGRKREMNL